MTPLSQIALGVVLLLGLATGAPAATGSVEGGATLVHDAAPEPPPSSARPHLRPRPAPDRFFDLVLTKPGVNPPPQQQNAD